MARPAIFYFLPLVLGAWPALAQAQENWPQFKFDSRHSGDAPDRTVSLPLGLRAAVPLTDGIYTSPVVADGRVYAVDGSGVAFAIDLETSRVVWKTPTAGGAANCNNVSSPVIAGPYLHFGTTAGMYYVLDRQTGAVARAVDCGDPIWSAPVLGDRRVYAATLGSKVFAFEPDGAVAWTWDFVREVIHFEGDRWSGEDWLKWKKGRVTWQEHFCCARDISLLGRMLVLPAGGRTVFLEDAGSRPELRALGEIPSYEGREFPACFGQSLGEAGEVYVQWHRRDNAGRVEILRLKDGQVQTDFVKGTQTAIYLPGLLSFCSVSLRGKDVYRARPESGLGLLKHTPGEAKPTVLSEVPSTAPPVLLRDVAIHGGLDGNLYIVPLSGKGTPFCFRTAFGRPITAPAAVSGGRVIFGGEDGYLYILGPDGQAALPTQDLGVSRLRAPLGGKFADARFDWYTNYGDFGCTNANDQEIRPPFRIRWARRVDGTVKHIPVCGGGRLYTHTAEGQITAVEQDTGRLLWRRFWPDVYLSFTSPLYIHEKLLIPQAGMKRSVVRCLDAATGALLWEAPFTGSPSWSRQFPPVVHQNVAIYASGSGRYAAQGSEPPFTFKGNPEKTQSGEEVMSWIYSNDNPYYPKDNKPLVWAWDLSTGKIAWQKDFSSYGSGGNDCGLALMDGKLYYSTFFGYLSSAKARRGLPVEANGLTACMDPQSGQIAWITTKYYVTGKCTLTARDGRLYVGGNNPALEGTQDRFVWCLDAKDGSLVWRSEPVTSALNVVSVGDQHVFSNALRGFGHVFDVKSGKIVGEVRHNYACCRFTLSEPYLLGANMDVVDLSHDGALVSTGPAVDSRECLGAIVSNGRVFYTSQASGIQVSQVAGADTRTHGPVWDRK
jgi:outer membrane protein assembly factor BamB